MDTETVSNVGTVHEPLEINPKNETSETDDVFEYHRNTVRCSECKKELPDDHEAVKNHMKNEHMPLLRKIKMPQNSPLKLSENSAMSGPSFQFSKENTEFMQEIR